MSASHNQPPRPNRVPDSIAYMQGADQETDRTYHKPSNRLLVAGGALLAGMALTTTGLVLNFGGGSGNNESLAPEPSASAPSAIESTTPTPRPSASPTPEKTASATPASPSPRPTPTPTPTPTPRPRRSTSTPSPTASPSPSPTPTTVEAPAAPTPRCEWPSIGNNQYTVANCGEGSLTAYDEPGTGEYTLTVGMPFEARCVTNGYIKISVANSDDYIKNPSYFDSSSLPQC
jgi:hypothetical protein